MSVPNNCAGPDGYSDRNQSLDRLPVGCAVLLVIPVSLLLWAVVWLLLWRLFGTGRAVDFQQNLRRRFVIRSCFSAIAGVAGQQPLASMGHTGRVTPG